MRCSVQYCPLQCSLWVGLRGGPMHCPLLTPPLQLPQESLQKPPKKKKSGKCLIFIVVGSFPFPPPIPAPANFSLSSVMALCSFTIKVIHQRDTATLSACLPGSYSWLQELHSLFLMSSYMVLGTFPAPSIPLTAQTL